MKKRIQVDSSILSLIIIGTGFLFLCKNIYPKNLLWDNILDVLGFCCILDGTLIRMAARGHKKATSQKSKNLVDTGPYSLVRNPMYLGSFLMGCGFALMVWPWWSLPLFAWLFYERFKHQVVKEEQYLGKQFGEAYQKYCAEVPRAIPSSEGMMRMRMKSVINLKEAFSTNEKRGLWAWPISPLSQRP